MGRFADRGEKPFFRRHKVALAEQGYAKIVMVIGATVVLAERGPQVGDVLVSILVPVLHRSVPLSSGVYNTIRRTRRCRGSVRLCSDNPERAIESAFVEVIALGAFAERMHEPAEQLLRGALARIDADIHRVVGLLEGIPFIVADTVDELPPGGDSCARKFRA